MDITFREIREYGEALVFLDQAPSLISLSALGNTYCTICLNLKHQKDVNAMAQCMLLDGAERDILGSLEVGEAVVKLQGRSPRPFMIRIPEFEIRKGVVSDEMVSERMPQVIDEETFLIADADETREPEQGYRIQQRADEPSLGPTSMAFLADVRDYPESGVAARYRRLGLSVRQGQKLKDKLVQQGLIQEHDEHTPTGRIKVVRLTEKGELAMSEHDKDE